MRQDEQRQIALINAVKGPVESFEDLAGRTLMDVQVTDDTITFFVTEDNWVKLYHSQDCCEYVGIEDICGDVEDLIGNMIVYAEEVSSSDVGFDIPDREDNFGSQTWTFYRIQSTKGDVVIRWLGESNGYYSERVDVEVCIDGETDRRW